MAKQKSLMEEASEYGWDNILSVLAPDELNRAVAKFETYEPHTTCPVHGTSKSNGEGDGFRLFKDFAEKGGGICSSCGGFSNGFRMLAWILQSRVEGQGIIHSKELKREFLDKAEEAVGEFLKHGTALYPESKRKLRVVEKTNELEESMAYLNRRRMIEEWWVKSHEFHPAIEAYFKGRGHKAPEISNFMRFAESLYMSGGVTTTYRDALLMPIIKMADATGKPEMKVLGVHRIFLDINDFVVTKAKVRSKRDPGEYVDPKQQFKHVPTSSGGCIPLYELIGDTLVVCEGPETAVALRGFTGLPVWSGVNTSMMASMMIPASVRHVIIGGDHDINLVSPTKSHAGLKAANALKERLEREGRKCTIMIPDMFPMPDKKAGKDSIGIDWDDVMRDYPEKGFDIWAPFRLASSPVFR